MKKLFEAFKTMMEDYNKQKKECVNNMAYVCQPGRLANITSC